MYALPLHTDAFGASATPDLWRVGEKFASVTAAQASSSNQRITLVAVPGKARAETVVAIPRGGLATVQRALADLRKYRRHAPNADVVSFDYAEKFLGLIASSSKPFHVSAQIFASGTAVLNVRSLDIEAQFEFMRDGTIAANLDAEQEIDLDVAGFDGRTIPAEIAEHLGVAAHR